MKTFKNKRETEKELPHIDTLIDGVYVGYMLYNSVKCTQTGKDWYFVPKIEGLKGQRAKSKKELIALIPDSL